MKNILVAAAILLLLPFYSLAQETPRDTVSMTPQELADSLLADAMQFLGTPYHYGSGGPKSFDCSGFTRYIYKRFGYNLTRSAKSQSLDGRPVEGDLSNLQKGDILVFGSRRNKSVIGHVGMFIETLKDGTDAAFIHAAHGGVKVSRLSETYYKERFIGVRRIIPDFVVVKSTVPVNVDTTAVAPQIDTLKLAEGDRRAIVFADGTWVWIREDGTPEIPEDISSIVLGGDGNWKIVQNSPVRIPKPEPLVTAGKEQAAVNPGTSEQTHVWHTVKSGDTLSAIARRYGTSVKSICALNGIKETSVLSIGKKLRVK